MALITPGILTAVGASPANAVLYAPLLEAARVVAGDDFNTITSKQGIAMLVSQLGHESGSFTMLSESLNYSVAALAGITAYFHPSEAVKYGYIKNSMGAYIQTANQQMIANIYYGTRLGNQGVASGDGWTFRGAGLIQITGRYNHTKFGVASFMPPDKAAEYARTPAGAVKAALWFWRTNNLLTPASQGDVTHCTQIIQGGDGGLADRLARYRTAFAALG